MLQDSFHGQFGPEALNLNRSYQIWNVRRIEETGGEIVGVLSVYYNKIERNFDDFNM